MRLTVMSKRFGQITYWIPDNVKDLCVSIDDKLPFIISDHENEIEPMKSFKFGDEIIRVDPSKKLEITG